MHITVEEFNELQPMETFVEEFVKHTQKYAENEPLGRWYAGITSDIAKRIERHQNEKKITCEHIKCFLCPSEAFAYKVEAALGEAGFSTKTKELKAAVKAAKMESISDSVKKEKDKVYIFYPDKEPVLS